ncbi:Hsp70 family protein [Dactylosporangium aurantiacum]|uniref:Hsp70 family protein n=2 Tax=Dactylosporangium aurantiacum TaxID=35754 RepID=A0A9Q9I6Y1_9ACTN|nr:Hsp70 family protein [Dactylosporangium aurantiacum]MDG6106555.1 Hsp70 family protein [Dactylosporangium aurantiacum]UWZ50417.1 Hsp70 family protein [Dactylosporangium aurantiacum]
MRVLGIDFGTSNTVAMVRTPDSRMRPLLFDGSPLLPSALYFNTDGKVLVGRDAERNARLDPARFEPNPKRRIDDGEVFIGDHPMPVPRLFAHVLSLVNTEARRQLGAAPDEVRMTHPARWGERRRSALVEAARISGLGNPRLIAEPVGAASYFTAVLGSAVPVGRSLAIYDLGGGTFDATVVRRTQSGFEVLAEDGLPDVGGLDFDHAIVEHLGKVYSQSHAEKWSSIANPADANARRQRRLLYEDVRGAKEMLSRTASTDIHLPALEVDAHLTREELEGLVKPYLERTVSCLRRAIESARLQPKDLVGIFLVGGSSRIPLAAHLIHTELGVAPTTLEQPETVVVEGALCIGSPSAPVHASGMPRTVTPPQPQQQRPVSAVPVSPAMNRPGPMQQPVQQPPMQQRPPVQLVRQQPPVQLVRQQPPPPQQPPVQLVRQQPPPPQQPPVQLVRQQPPVQQPQQPYRPPVSPAPVAQPARPGPFPPQPARPAPQPAQQQTDEGERNWVAVIIVVLVLVAVLFVILLMTAFNG